MHVIIVFQDINTSLVVLYAQYVHSDGFDGDCENCGTDLSFPVTLHNKLNLNNRRPDVGVFAECKQLSV